MSRREIELNKEIKNSVSKIHFYNKKIEICKDQLDQIREEKRKKQIDIAFSIIDIIRKRFSLSDEYNTIISREEKVIIYTYMAIKMVENNTELPLDIFESLFNKDRSTITYALKTVDGLLDSDKSYKLKYDAILIDNNLKYKIYKPRRSGRLAY